jgi:hypothetical protein
MLKNNILDGKRNFDSRQLLFYQSSFQKIDFDLRLIFTFQTFVVFKVSDTSIVFDLFHEIFQVLS